MKIYEGNRYPVVRVVVRDGTIIYPLIHVLRHSPDGFEWGYGGSGPADLALSILTDYLGDQEIAYKFYQAFKWAFIALFPHTEWKLSGDEIEQWFTSKYPFFTLNFNSSERSLQKPWQP